MKTWSAIEDIHGRVKSVHIVPVKDLRRHNQRGRGCWCQPRVDGLPNGWVLVVHNAVDGRDLIEQHGVN